MSMSWSEVAGYDDHGIALLQIERAILYDHVKKDVSKWNSVVYHNRLADNLVFPLEPEKLAASTKSKNIGVDEDFVVRISISFWKYFDDLMKQWTK